MSEWKNSDRSGVRQMPLDVYTKCSLSVAGYPFYGFLASSPHRRMCYNSDLPVDMDHCSSHNVFESEDQVMLGQIQTQG